MASKLLNVRLDAARLRKAKRLRARGVTLSDVVRDAIDTRYGEMTGETAGRDAVAIVREILDANPDPDRAPTRSSGFPYRSFTGIPLVGDNLSALLVEVPVHNAHRMTKIREDGMAAAETTTRESERERIERWRAEELERAGYEPSAASLLAARSDVDLHYAVDLLRNGCNPELALQILL